MRGFQKAPGEQRGYLHEQIRDPQRGCVHGLGEHSGRYGRLAKMLGEAGFAVYTFDWSGHGGSSGKRGHTSIEEGMKIIDDIVR